MDHYSQRGFFRSSWLLVPTSSITGSTCKKLEGKRDTLNISVDIHKYIKIQGKLTKRRTKDKSRAVSRNFVAILVVGSFLQQQHIHQVSR